jgi:rare lipoprotein A
VDNGRSVDVVINDRGPFAKGRVIDLSYAAGQALGMIGPGTVPVRLEVLESPRPLDAVPAALDYTLQVGSFSQIENARQLRNRLAASYPDAAIVPFRASETTYFRVQVGNFSERAAAEEQARRLAQAGLPVIVMER